MNTLKVTILICLAITGTLLIVPSQPTFKVAPAIVKATASLQTHLKLQNRGWKICGALLSVSGMQLISPFHSFAASTFVGTVVGWTIAGFCINTYLVKTSKQKNTKFDFALIAYIEQISLSISNGKSLQSALTSVDNFNNEELLNFQNLLRSGLDTESAASFWIEQSDSKSKRRLLDLITAKTTAAESLKLMELILKQLRQEKRFSTLAEIERRNQLVWIPVTIAVLLPGMIFIAIPLEAALRSLLV